MPEFSDVRHTLEERARLADAVRALLEEIVSADITDNDAAATEATIESVTESLRALPRRGLRPARLPDLNDLQPSFFADPIIGASNPVAPPVSVVVEDGVVRGRVSLGAPYEGPPGHVHGAIIAGIFDMLLGLANIAAGNPGMTGTLTIRYREPTPLHTDLAIECWTDKVEGRKIFTLGTLHAGDTLCAEAKGLFVSLGSAKAAAIFENRR